MGVDKLKRFGYYRNMIYATKERAIEVADELNRTLKGWGAHRAARTTHGWQIRRVSPYSNGDVLEWA